MEEVSVVVVPFPAQGHLNQLLHFSLLLSTHNLSVHYATTATHGRQARDRIHGWPPAALHRIHFHDFPIPSFDSPSPDPNAATHFPSHLQPAFEASEHLNAPIAALLRSLSAATRRVVLIEESVMSFAGRAAAALPNVEIYTYMPVPAFFALPYHWDAEAPVQPAPSAAVLRVIHAKFENIAKPEFWDFLYRRRDHTLPDVGIVINTCRPVEGEFIELFAQQPAMQKKKIYAVGPVNPLVPHGDGSRRHECLEWLDGQPAASVVYVSFGTTCAIAEEQAAELAAGLQQSGQRFIWVLRDADKGDIYAGGEREILPGYEGEEGRGLVLRGWAPQLEILAHRATGAFMSHCGWNSCMESMSNGVPMLAWPMHSDQPRNAMVVTEYLKVGLMVSEREWEMNKETVTTAEIKLAIKKLLVGEEGKEIRTRAEELGEAVRTAVAEGGSSRVELDSFVAHITR